MRSVKGVLPTAFAASQFGRGLFVLVENAGEAVLMKELSVYEPNYLLQIFSHLSGIERLFPHYSAETVKEAEYPMDLSDVKKSVPG